MKRGLIFTDANFEDEVLSSEIPVLVDFWGSWCPACKMVEPIIDELASEMDGKIKVGKINVDQNPRIGSFYNINGVPTFILLKPGTIVGRVTGARSKRQLLNLIKEAEIITDK